MAALILSLFSALLTTIGGGGPVHARPAIGGGGPVHARPAIGGGGPVHASIGGGGPVQRSAYMLAVPQSGQAALGRS